MIILCFFLAFGMNPACAQSGKTAIREKSSDRKAHALVFTSTLGDVPGDQAIPVSFAKSLLNLPIRVHDNRQRSCPVVSFSFGYETFATYTNDTTGMPQKTPSYISYPFNSDRLDSLWRTRIGDELKSGDQLYFDHIIVRDTTGAFHLSSPLHFTIK